MDVLALAPVGRSPAQPSGRKRSLLIPTLSLSLLAVGGDGTRHLALHWAAAGTRWDHKCWVDTRSLKGLGQQDRDGSTQRGTPNVDTETTAAHCNPPPPPECLMPFLA